MLKRLSRLSIIMAINLELLGDYVVPHRLGIQATLGKHINRIDLYNEPQFLCNNSDLIRDQSVSLPPDYIRGVRELGLDHSL